MTKKLIPIQINRELHVSYNILDRSLVPCTTISEVVVSDASQPSDAVDQDGPIHPCCGWMRDCGEEQHNEHQALERDCNAVDYYTPRAQVKTARR